MSNIAPVGNTCILIDFKLGMSRVENVLDLFSLKVQADHIPLDLRCLAIKLLDDDLNFLLDLFKLVVECLGQAVSQIFYIILKVNLPDSIRLCRHGIDYVLLLFELLVDVNQVKVV